jgi:hypothetical protein
MELAEPTLEAALEALARRYSGAFVFYLHPFRLIEPGDEETWSASIDEINRHGWDYVGLHEVVGRLDVGLPEPFNLMVARDGAVGLPALAQFASDQAAVQFINQCFGALLLGGVYCEAVSCDGLELGGLLDWTYIRVHRHGLAAPNVFHEEIRRRQASPLQAIALCQPRRVALSALTAAMAIGRAVLDRLPNLSGEFLLRGVTGVARRDPNAGLADLWIVNEQLLSGLWEAHVLKPADRPAPSGARRDQLADSRTWTASARAELLHQKGVLPLEALTLLSRVRKARNALVHQGASVSMEEAETCLSATKALLRVTLDGEALPFFDLDLADHGLSDPFTPPVMRAQPTHWMPILELPGELEINALENEVRRAHRAQSDGDP